MCTAEAIIDSDREHLQEMDRAAHVDALHLLAQREQELRSQLERQQQYNDLRQASPTMHHSIAGVLPRWKFTGDKKCV